MLLSELSYESLDLVYEALRQEGIARFGALLEHYAVLEAVERLPGLITEEKRKLATLNDKAHPQVVADLRGACAASDAKAISRSAGDLADLDRNIAEKASRIKRMEIALDILRELAENKPERVQADLDTLLQAMRKQL